MDNLPNTDEANHARMKCNDKNIILYTIAGIKKWYFWIQVLK